MLSKTISVTLIVSSFVLQGYAHAGITPALGVKGTLVRSDVQRPSTAKPCGTIPFTDIDTSTAVPADAQGNVNLNATNFNAGADGSLSFSAQVNEDGTGKTFTAAKVTKNGDAAPTKVASQPLVVQLPENTKCTGGKTGNLCILSLKTTAGFGNCVVVSQGATASKGAVAAPTGGCPAHATATNDATTAAAPAKASSMPDAKDANLAGASSATKTDGSPEKMMHHSKGKSNEGTKVANKPAGARYVRSILSSGKEPATKRSVLAWFWA